MQELEAIAARYNAPSLRVARLDLALIITQRARSLQATETKKAKQEARTQRTMKDLYAKAITDHNINSDAGRTIRERDLTIATQKRAIEDVLRPTITNLDYALKSAEAASNDWRSRYLASIEANKELVAKVKELRDTPRGTIETASLQAKIAHLERQLASADATLKRLLPAYEAHKKDLEEAITIIAMATEQGLKDADNLNTAIGMLHGYMCLVHGQSVAEHPDKLANTKPYIHPYIRHKKDN